MFLAKLEMSWRVDEAESCGGRLFPTAAFSEEVAPAFLTSASIGLCRETKRKLGIGRSGEMELEEEN